MTTPLTRSGTSTCPVWTGPAWSRRCAGSSAAPVAVDNDVNLAAIAERRRGVGQRRGNVCTALARSRPGPRDRPRRLADARRTWRRRRDRLHAARPAGPPHLRYENNDLDGILAGPAVLALAADHGGWSRPIRTTRCAPAVPRSSRTLAQRVAVGMAAVVAVLDPDLVVLAGAVAQAGGERLRDAVAIAIRTASPLEAQIATTAVTDDAVLLGASTPGLGAVREDLIRAVQDVEHPPNPSSSRIKEIGNEVPSDSRLHRRDQHGYRRSGGRRVLAEHRPQAEADRVAGRPPPPARSPSGTSSPTARPPPSKASSTTSRPATRTSRWWSRTARTTTR